MNKTKHIICTIDDNYVQHCIVMLASLFSTNKKSIFHIYILSNGLLNDNINYFEKFFRWKRHTYTHIKIDESLLKGAPISGHVSLATYYRLLIPKILPVKISKVLFLDSDLIINGSISKFWEIDIENYSHIAIENCGNNKPFIQKIEMNQDSKYFNAGVMLINLNWWRVNNVFEKSIAYLKSNSDKITFWDQDVLNNVLENMWYEFPFKYNAQSYFFSNKIDRAKFCNEEIEAIEKPIIVHFTGGGDSKPWYFSNNHPYKNKYEYFKDKTMFKNVLPIGNPYINNLTWRDKFYLFRVNIFKKKQ